MTKIWPNTSFSGRGQRGINFKNRARNGRAAELGVIFVKRTAQRGVIEIILECNKACVPRIG